MRKIVYIGSKAAKFDNVAKTGLSWTRGQVQEVEDDLKAEMLLGHPHVWQAAEKEYKLAPEIAAVPEPEPRVNIVPQGGEETTIYWDPIVVAVTGDVFKRIQANELQAVFMSPADAQLFSEWKGAPKQKQWKDMDKAERDAYQAAKKAA